MSEEYVVEGAMLKCSASDDEYKRVALYIEDDRKIKIDGKYVANKSDIYVENIPSFGLCKNLSQEYSVDCSLDDDSDETDTESEDEEECKQPCEREGNREDGGIGSLTPWLDCKDDVLIAGHPAVLESSYLMCIVGGGTISIDEETGSGQSG